MPKDLDINWLTAKVVHVVRKFMIFENISIRQIEKILNIHQEAFEQDYHKRVVKLCSYEKEETVIKEGEFDSCAFWVVKGDFDVVQDGHTIAAFSKPGEIFGEMSVFEGIPRTASVISKSESICLCIDMSLIENLHDPDIEAVIRRNFDAVILNRLNETKQKISRDKEKLDKKYRKITDFEFLIRSKNISQEPPVN